MQLCDRCSGTGEIVTRESRYGAPSKCPACAGSGTKYQSMEMPGDKPTSQVLKDCTNDQLLTELRRRDVHGDVRIRQVFDNYRCVAPGAKRSNGDTYANGGLVIETVMKDSLGTPTWVEIGRFGKPVAERSLHADNSVKLEYPLAVAIYKLLAQTNDRG